MKEFAFYRILLISWYGVAAIIFVALLFIPAPYGRHSRPSWGPSIQARFGWMIMEAVSSVGFCGFFLLGNREHTPVTLFFMLLWLIHYIQRSFVYPFLIKNGRKPMALSIVGMAIFFNIINTYLNGRYLNWFSTVYTRRWVQDPRFIIGLILFFSGFFINIHSDWILRKLRSEDSDNYGIPHGGLFEWISSANYFGEVVEWFGWACLTWSYAGLSFAVWTAANLVPRARSHHKWYITQFADYPKNRKAILPFLF